MQIFNIEKTIYNQSNTSGTKYNVTNWLGYTSNLNNGEVKEYELLQYYKGKQAYHKDSTPHTKGSDIVHNNKYISVKSNGATLYKTIVDNNIVKTIQEYIMVDYSNTYIYMIDYNDKYMCIEMNKQEFTVFLIDNATIDKANKCLRIRKADNKIMQWLKEFKQI